MSFSALFYGHRAHPASDGRSVATSPYQSAENTIGSGDSGVPGH
jgi:hypothetical protein